VHPILGRANRLASYLAAWTIAAVLVAAILTRLGLTPVEALAFVVPLFLVYSFACLSAWYVCRANPLRTSSLFRVLTSGGLTAIIAGAVWLAIARVWIMMLSATPTFTDASARFDQQLPLLFAVGVLLFLLAIAVHYALLALEAAREAEHRRLHLEVLAREAELRALRAQINPHFLYNSLNSISALTGSDPAGARRMCLLLGDFLRQTLRVSGHEGIRLADEIALADRFLDIEQVRFGSRLQVERRIDDGASECLVPPLILQPLVENAVAHGIAGLLDGGIIRVHVSRHNGSLSIAIENPRDADAAAPVARGLGLENVRRRLATMFGSDARLETRTGPDSFHVEIEMPWSVHD
jgi:two-component system, LytTR family, sensor histidine kinase AlgZ